MAKKKKKDDIALLQDEMDKVHQQIRDAYERFNWADDDYLIDACIYEINAYKAKYNYLLRCVKEKQGYPIARPHAQVVHKTAEPCVAASAVEGGTLCRS